jgi:hypothetical protein
MSATSARHQRIIAPAAAPDSTAQAASRFGRAGRSGTGRSPITAPIPSRLLRLLVGDRFCKREAPCSRQNQRCHPHLLSLSHVCAAAPYRPSRKLSCAYGDFAGAARSGSIKSVRQAKSLKAAAANFNIFR